MNRAPWWKGTRGEWLVRHPMYSGGLVLALGWALFVRGWLTLGYVAALFGFRRLIPFVY